MAVRKIRHGGGKGGIIAERDEGSGRERGQDTEMGSCALGFLPPPLFFVLFRPSDISRNHQSDVELLSVYLQLRRRGDFTGCEERGRREKSQMQMRS